MEVKVKANNQTFISVDTSKEIVAKKISKNFLYMPEGYKYDPKYKFGGWDGKIRVFDKKNGQLPYGLFPDLVTLCDKNNYTIDNPDNVGKRDIIKEVSLIKFIKTLNITINDKPLKYDDYRFMCQFNAIHKSLEYNRCVLQAPTGIGKSLIIYCLLRYWQENIKKDGEKCIVVVPSVQLVDQMYSDFSNYSANDSWEHQDNLYKIYQGASKDDIEQDIIISTYQSINKQPQPWFNKFSMVIGDEAHKFTATTLNLIMDNCINAVYRIGTTGTAGTSKTNIMVLKGEFGRILNISKTKKLQDKNILSDLLINVIKLNYSLDTRKKYHKDNPMQKHKKIKNFQKEVDWVVSNEKRNKFIKNLAISRPGNTLVMFQLVEKHGKVLYEMIKNEADCKVFYISGEIKKEEREQIRALVEKQEKSIIVASFGTFAEGINIKNLHNLILASPTKSETKIIQSIGRLLRLSENGQSANLYDIFDNLRMGKWANTSLNHIDRRLEYYKEQEFKVKKYQVKLT